MTRNNYIPWSLYPFIAGGERKWWVRRLVGVGRPRARKKRERASPGSFGKRQIKRKRKKGGAFSLKNAILPTSPSFWMCPDAFLNRFFSFPFPSNKDHYINPHTKHPTIQTHFTFCLFFLSPPNTPTKNLKGCGVIFGVLKYHVATPHCKPGDMMRIW